MKDQVGRYYRTRYYIHYCGGGPRGLPYFFFIWHLTCLVKFGFKRPAFVFARAVMPSFWPKPKVSSTPPRVRRACREIGRADVAGEGAAVAPGPGGMNISS